MKDEEISFCSWTIQTNKGKSITIYSFSCWQKLNLAQGNQKEEHAQRFAQRTRCEASEGPRKSMMLGWSEQVKEDGNQCRKDAKSSPRRTLQSENPGSVLHVKQSLKTSEKSDITWLSFLQVTLSALWRTDCNWEGGWNGKASLGCNSTGQGYCWCASDLGHTMWSV